MVNLKHKIKLQIYEAVAQTLHTLSRSEVRKELFLNLGPGGPLACMF